MKLNLKKKKRKKRKLPTYYELFISLSDRHGRTIVSNGLQLNEFDSWGIELLLSVLCLLAEEEDEGEGREEPESERFLEEEESVRFLAAAAAP